MPRGLACALSGYCGCTGLAANSSNCKRSTGSLCWPKGGRSKTRSAAKPIYAATDVVTRECQLPRCQKRPTGL